MNAQLLTAVSVAVAEFLNNQESGDLEKALAEIYPANFTARDKSQCLVEARIYNLSASLPGNPPDGKPGWLSSNVDPKAAVLNEINAMMKADFDGNERKQAWTNLLESLRNAQEQEFANGVDINCPDDYILSLKVMSCQTALNGWN